MAVVKMKFGLILSWILIFLACSTVGVSVAPNSTERIMSEGENLARVSLSGKATKENDKLVVEYTVRNTLSHSIYVFDEMIEYDSNGQPKINRSTAYCFWEEPETLRLVRAILRVPLEKDVYSLEIPYARELKAQAEITGRIELDLPVNEKKSFLCVADRRKVKTYCLRKDKLTDRLDGVSRRNADYRGKHRWRKSIANSRKLEAVPRKRGVQDPRSGQYSY